MNIHSIISFDPKKVWFEYAGSGKICRKKTTYNEVQTLLQAQKYIDGRTIKVSDIEYTIATPDVIGWDDVQGVLTMSFCEGDNLESLICNSQTRQYGVKLTREFLRFILINRFFWKDFAPRNIIINGNRIYILDFEHGISNQDITLADFLRLRVYREYSSFLLPTETALTIDKVFTLKQGEPNETINVDSCSRRIITIAKALGYYPEMNTKQSLEIQKRIILAEQPFIENGRIVYPRIWVEKLLEEKSDGSFEEYAKFVIEKSQSKQLTNTGMEI